MQETVQSLEKITPENTHVDKRKIRMQKMARELGRKGVQVRKEKGIVRGPNKSTLTKEEAYRRVQERIIERSLKLTNAQTMLGLGTIRVYRVDGHYEYFGKTKKLVKEKPKIVDNIDEITKVLDWEYGTHEEDPSNIEDDGNDYPKFYFVETKEANNQAIDSQLNRLFGKATEKQEIDVKGGAVPVIVGMRIIDNSNKSLPDPKDNAINITENT